MVKKFVFITGAALLALCAPIAVYAEDAVAPVVKPAPVDPARLVIAQKAVAKLIPPGTYQKMMKEIVDQMTNGILSQMLGMDASVFAKVGGVDENSDAVKALNGKSLNDIAAEEDPYFKERMNITMKVVFEEMGALMNEMEPGLRTALSNVYARKYTVQQLRDIDAFFATPSGAAFSANFMATFTDKEMMQVSMDAVPKMMGSMNGIMDKVKSATAHLPKPKTERAEVSETATSESFAYETGEEPWYSEENWTVAQQKEVAALYSKYIIADDKQSTTYQAYKSEYDKAVAAARDALKPDFDRMIKEKPAIAPENIPANAPPPPALPKP